MIIVRAEGDSDTHFTFGKHHNLGLPVGPAKPGSFLILILDPKGWFSRVLEDQGNFGDETGCVQCHCLVGA